MREKYEEIMKIIRNRDNMDCIVLKGDGRYIELGNGYFEINVISNNTVDGIYAESNSDEDLILMLIGLRAKYDLQYAFENWRRLM